MLIVRVTRLRANAGGTVAAMAMARAQVEVFSREHVDGAADLLAKRHERHRAAEPLLSARYEDPAVARAEIEAVLAQESASGAVALVGDEVAAYVLGAPREVVWGPNVWVRDAGHAARDAELLLDVYALAAAAWVEREWTAQYVLVPATEASLVDAWFRLGFGQQHAHAIVEVATVRKATVREGVVIRRAAVEDIDAAIYLDPLLADYHAGSPVFARRGGDETPPEQLRQEWVEEIEDERVGSFFAHRSGRVVGGITVAPVELSGAHSGLARPDSACVLGWAVTTPEERESGVGLALTAQAFAWARERGYPTMVIDWRTANPMASRFWPPRGFRTSFLRLYRSIP